MGWITRIWRWVRNNPDKVAEFLQEIRELRRDVNDLRALVLRMKKDMEGK